MRPSEVQAWATDRGKVLSPATLRKLVMMLRSVYADAVGDRRVAVSPAIRLTLPRTVAERVVPLSVEQVRALADAMAPHYQAMVLTQAGLGLRTGELLGLRVGDVDFLRRTVRVEHQSDLDTRELVPPKTARSRRTVPLPSMVADALAAHLAARPATEDIGCACPPSAGCSRSRSGLIFHTSTARPLDHFFYGGRVFGAAVVKANTRIREANAKLPAGAARAVELPAGTTTHDLRHHFASVLLQAGESVVAVAEWLGHESAVLVLTTYGHLMPGSEDRMPRAIDTAYSPSADSCAPTVPQRSSITP